MAHWQGFVMGNRGDATRLGSKKSGMQAFVASWSGRCEVDGYIDSEGVDCVTVRLTQHHNAGAFPAILIYDGPIVGTPELVANGHAIAALTRIANHESRSDHRRRGMVDESEVLDLIRIARTALD